MGVIDEPDLHTHGFVHMRGVDWLELGSRDPWALARELVGDELVLVEAHPIAPRPNGRSYAASKRETPLHTDSQSHRGVPPHLQVLICAQPAARGGESLVLDSWALLDTLERGDPDLYRALFEVPRRLPFVFGDVVGPTVALRGHALVCSHPPIAVADEVGRALGPRLASAAKHELALARHDALVVDNHRMLHGRRAFEDDRRKLLRLLIWTDAPSRAPGKLLAAARTVHARNRVLLADEPIAIREAVLGPQTDARSQRLEIVLALLHGESPGRLAHQHRIPEPELYRWRDAALRSAASSLAGLDEPASHHAALERVRARLRRGSP